ncbi:MAG: thioredoxin-like domain-containing protein [Bacteroidales bacterium]
MDDHQKFEHKMNLLHQMVDQYPKDDPFYEQVADKYLLVQKKHEKYIDSLAQQHSNMFAAHVIKSYKTPVLEPGGSPEEKYSYLKEHFLNSIDFQDTLLIRTPRLGQKILRYLSLYRSQGLSRSEQEQKFIKAVDEILLHAYINDRMYNYVLEYLVKGFEQFNMEKVLAHIYEKNLSGEACKDNNADVKKRLEQYAKLSPGKKAPDFTFNPLNESKTQLSEMESPYTLLLFYASWCGHCQNSVPKIHEVYQNYKDKGLEVVAISLDEEKDKYQAFLEKEDYEWVNYCDYKKWESPIVQKYNIYATPTMLLLKEDMTIAGKPITVDELKKALEGLDWE